MLNNLKHKNILITAGATFEKIDPVRYIGNRSSGKMGVAIANAFAKNGAIVTLIKSNINENIFIDPLIKIINKESAAEVYETTIKLFSKIDIIIMSAAIADYTPIFFEENKIKKTKDTFILKLKKTNDILFELGEIKKQNQYIVGFSLETNNAEENAIAKMKNKNCDMMILNSLNKNNNPFGSDKNTITIFFKNNTKLHFKNKSKIELADIILNYINNDLI